MELSERYTALLTDFEKALKSFSNALEMDKNKFSVEELDLFQNGCIQKFEYTTELAWKLGKVLLEWNAGEMQSSPKQVIRAMFSYNFIDENLSQCLLKTIEDRNALSHVYKEELYESVLVHLPAHADCLQQYLVQLKQKGV
ncbi:HI0074 family nucleotidyltransferase substrate-binding subunit [Solitalea koreensis]|uniref:Nucleotidyltransferase substrate binding protein, HI0074 family n=1 Tax=Solitalea koreensis TaxID=543615 RepID=A0A521CR40_9SPHI|nr:HI0074 family nucleotidyltransferase substrate-binding subunit [Solitalea koreensis]SMO61221.1 nucleotidyltransferase substrate binding protein, HI0074 family [Solitalea koreensis]